MELFLVTRDKKKITKACRRRHHCLGFIQSPDQQAAGFFRVVMSLNCPFVYLWNFAFGAPEVSWTLSQDAVQLPAYTVQDIAMLCRFAKDMVSPNK